jgi:hypothetical protein
MKVLIRMIRGMDMVWAKKLTALFFMETGLITKIMARVNLLKQDNSMIVNFHMANSYQNKFAQKMAAFVY